MKIFQTRLEKDFEIFVNGLPKLEPVEFCGIAKILGVSMVYKEKMVEFDKEKYNEMDEDEKMEYVAQFNRPMNEILEEVMDAYLALSKRQRKEINQLLKDIKRGR